MNWIILAIVVGTSGGPSVRIRDIGAHSVKVEERSGLSSAKYETRYRGRFTSYGQCANALQRSVSHVASGEEAVSFALVCVPDKEEE